MARPTIEIDKTEFEKLCMLFCTLTEIADFFDCTDDTINNWCKKEYGESFSGVYKRKSSKGKISLRRKQFQVAMAGDRGMLIWLGKQYLGQSDKLDFTESEGFEFTSDKV
jgi:hypothetical protein